MIKDYGRELRGNCANNFFGPSGVHALPLAAGINEGGHYFRYFFLSFFLLLQIFAWAPK
jgi:hypothetical protein